MTVPHPAPGGGWLHPRRWRCATAPRFAAPTPARSPEWWSLAGAVSSNANCTVSALPQSPAPLVERILSDPALATERPGLLPTGLLFGDQLAPVLTSLLPHPSSIQPLRPPHGRVVHETLTQDHSLPSRRIVRRRRHHGVRRVAARARCASRRFVRAAGLEDWDAVNPRQHPQRRRTRRRSSRSSSAPPRRQAAKRSLPSSSGTRYRPPARWWRRVSTSRARGCGTSTTRSCIA